MMSSKKITALAAACLVAGGAAFAQGSSGTAASGGSNASGSTGASGGAVTTRQPVHTQSMQRLQDAADRLRQSIQALAQKPPGAERERAIASAQDALMRTQQAMMALPPELRSSGTVSTGDYDKSVKKLMASADSLRQAIQEMAQQPAGERRNQAIREAHQALWDAQTAMVAAYQPGGSNQASGGAPAAQSGSSAQAMGASSMQSSSGSAGRQDQAAATSGSGGAGGTGRQVSRSATSPGPEPAAVLVLLPNVQAQGNRLADGCWVRFFDDKNFGGAALTLAGPVDLPRMQMGDLWRDWDSAVVGPKATVRTYDNENFRERTAVLDAGQSIPDLRDQKLGWFEEVKSARVSCG